MSPSRGEFLKGFKEEFAFGKAGMRYFKGRSIKDEIINGDNVEVYHAITIGSVGVSMGFTIYQPLDFLKFGQHFPRFKVGLEAHTDIEEVICTLKTLRGGFNDMRSMTVGLEISGTVTENVAHSTDGAGDIETTLALVGADVDEICFHCEHPETC